MPFDPEKLAEFLITLLITSSIMLVAAAVAWRIAVKPTMRAFFEHRGARAGDDPVLSRRMTELEDELRAVKERLAALPEGAPSRLLGADVPWRGTKEKT
jgi:hypothetical protein